MSRRGHTLMELVAALAVAGVLAVGLASTMAVAVRMFPNRQGAAHRALQGARILDRLNAELELAVHVTELNPSSIGFTVPDRTGDGLPERIRYAWSTVPRGQLTRQCNGGTVVTLASDLQQFTLVPSVRSVSEGVPGLGSEETEEVELCNLYSTSGLGNNDITTANWFGQCFQATLPAEATAWRPTRVRFLAKRNSVPGVTLVQMSPADANFKPTPEVLEQHTLADTALTTAYQWVDFPLGMLSPLAPDGAICLVLTHQAGSKACTVQNNSGFPGLVKTGNGGGSWSYDTGKALTCQLYGKRTLAGQEQRFINANYLMSAELFIQMTADAPTFHATSSLLNHPELLNGYWELKFDVDPTQVELNGDGEPDWVVAGGGTLPGGAVSGGAWRASQTRLVTNPGCDFATPTVVDLRFRSLQVGGEGAVVMLNASRSGAECAPLLAALRLLADGSQLLTVYKQTDDATRVPLLQVSGLPNRAIDLHLVVEPANPSVSVSVNGVQRGTFLLARFVAADPSRGVTIGTPDGEAEFTYARVRVLE